MSALSNKIISIPHLLRFLRLKTPCALCRCLHDGPYAVCSFCEAMLPRLGPACTHCATPLANTKQRLCSPCSKKKPALDQVFATYRFEEPLRTLLHDFKYRESLHLTQFLTSIMSNNSNQITQTECLIPVPSHKKRLKQRGFNHAVLLAQHLAKTIQRPCLTSHIQKIIDTPSQAKLDAPERRRNLQQAFRIKPVPYQHVTLVDDLITTGSTANELAAALKAEGVTRVDLWCIAKTCLV